MSALRPSSKWGRRALEIIQLHQLTRRGCLQSRGQSRCIRVSQASLVASCITKEQHAVACITHTRGASTVPRMRGCPVAFLHRGRWWRPQSFSHPTAIAEFPRSAAEEIEVVVRGGNAGKGRGGDDKCALCVYAGERMLVSLRHGETLSTFSWLCIYDDDE